MDPSRKVWFPEKLFDHQIYTSLRCIIKNVTDILLSMEQSVTFNYSYGNQKIAPLEISKLENIEDEVIDTSDFNIASFTIQLLVTMGIVWVLDRHFLKTSVIPKFVEAIVIWWLIFITLPIFVFIGGAILVGRIALIFKFKILDDEKFRLMEPHDAVWTFEHPKSTSTCNGLYVIKGDGELDKIRDVVLRRVLDKEDENGHRIYGRLRWSIVKKFGFMCWNTDTSKFDINSHIRYCQRQKNVAESGWTEDDVFQIAGELQDISLNTPGKSPWEMLVIPKFIVKNQTENHYAILCRIHHSLGDGISMGHILHHGIADEPLTFSVDPISPLEFSKFTIWMSYLVSFFFLPQSALRQMFFHERNAFHSDKMLTGPKSVNWSRTIALSAIKDLKNKSRTSVFTVLLSCLTGAMARLYKKCGHPVPDIIHAAPPVAILPYPDRNPRNRFSVVLYPLATGKENPLERLHDVFNASKKLAASSDVLTNYFVIYALGLLPFDVMKLLAVLAHATISFSNIPGPVNQVKVFRGDTLVEIGAWIPVKNRIGIAMGMFSYNDKLRVTFIADKVSLPNSDDLDLLRDYFETELVSLAQMLEINSNSHNQLFI